MLTFTEARQVAQECAAKRGLQLMEQETREFPFGWHFVSQWLGPRDGDWHKALAGGMFVDRDDGHVFLLSRERTLDEEVALYESGYRFSAWQLRITEVVDLEAASETLAKLGMGYVAREVAHGRTWSVGYLYTVDQLRSLLQHLPLEFKTLELSPATFQLLKICKSFSYTLTGVYPHPEEVMYHPKQSNLNPVPPG